MKKALLIISHGSRRAASNEEVFALTRSIRELVMDPGSRDTQRQRTASPSHTTTRGSGNPVRQNTGAEPTLTVECAFLEIARPDIQETIDKLAEMNITSVQVFPHFLAAGAHVTSDIPREINAAKNRHPQITFCILPHLGSFTTLPALILNLIHSANLKQPAQE